MQPVRLCGSGLRDLSFESEVVDTRHERSHCHEHGDYTALVLKQGASEIRMGLPVMKIES